MFGHWKHAWHQQANEERMRRPRWGYRRPKYNVPVNIIEHGDSFEVWIYAITYAKEDIKVWVADETLYISGKRTPEGEPNFLLHEYPIKSFERSFELSERVDKSGIQAKHENGILKVVVPKTKAASEPEVSIDID